MELERICRLLKQRGERVITKKNSIETFHEKGEDYYRLERERLAGGEQWHYFYVRSKKENVLEKEHLASYTDEREGARIFYLWTMRSHYREKYIWKIHEYLRETDYDISPDVATVERALAVLSKLHIPRHLYSLENEQKPDSINLETDWDSGRSFYIDLKGKRHRETLVRSKSIAVSLAFDRVLMLYLFYQEQDALFQSNEIQTLFNEQERLVFL
ncbi:hypothetical protein BMT55_04710 [Listeria newyorkensis]|uniref:Uncharacterized protein n=1 Tax=Listeria newyorkensis TaxID=1497681 RepID=A0ABX4XPE1_9LIST|nr:MULTISPECIES: hypothetical protein [Listeria]KGL45120.1 hypothetical protein EP56_06065 [Listeriaceae bacterium FSL A5-0209]KGL40016.1 hypothetical protein EP58_12720 [Listeria newyorkensis]KMT63605.1 hypothetical protein X559_0170 [Listeria newyorkensis]PNP93300.1 hypothetical protein BMT55_04710 [Listeria newyorkensis]RQW68238.1 hypothetical protein DUK53_02380 [Listeria sp. SHR_NRA_18]